MLPHFRRRILVLVAHVVTRTNYLRNDLFQVPE